MSIASSTPQHHIVIDQLEFGEKTASKDAVSLPVKLAVALLKDRNGVIDLPLPVTGSLDDPKFRLGPIIWKVLLNILEKAVTAPVRFAGFPVRLGSQPSIHRFSTGLERSGGCAVRQGQGLVKALQERPQLKLEIPIATVPDLDRPALVATAFQSQIAEVQTQSLRKAAERAQPRPRRHPSISSIRPPSSMCSRGSMREISAASLNIRTA